MTTKMRPIRETIPLDEARAIIDRNIAPLTRVERIPLHQAHGRVLARAAVATSDVPPFERAAMDGYAVRAQETAGASRTSPRMLRHIGKLFTGQVSERPVGPGECLEIATGAPMPPGADAVVIVEDTDITDSRVSVFSAVAPQQNVGRQGSDIQAGQMVLDAGEWLTPSRVGALAALGLTEVDVFAQPRVAILSTGNEIVEPGQALAGGEIYDVNKFTVAGVVSEHGGVPVFVRTASPTRSTTCHARWTNASHTTSWSSPAAAPSASAI